MVGRCAVYNEIGHLNVFVNINSSQFFLMFTSTCAHRVPSDHLMYLPCVYMKAYFAPPPLHFPRFSDVFFMIQAECFTIRRATATIQKIIGFHMVLILHDNSEIVAHNRNNHSYLVCLSHLTRSRVVTNRVFFSERPIFLHACVTWS